MLKKNYWYSLILMSIFTLPIFGIPPKNIPPAHKEAFTLKGSIPVLPMYFDQTYSQPRVYDTHVFDKYIKKAIKRETFYYGQTDVYLYKALDELATEIRGKEVCVIGSGKPWYESVLLSYGCRPVVIEYQSIICTDPRVVYFTPEQFDKNPRKFDYILSISSIEHDGLGRYGDPIDPNGDLKSMNKHKEMLKPNGKLILSMPVGPDCLVWNAHRIYGPIRLKMLFKEWKQVKYFGFRAELLLSNKIGDYTQPIFILQPK